MEGIVEFKTEQIPDIAIRSKFPYDKLAKSLRTLEGTSKCVVLERDEITQNQCQQLRTQLKKVNKWLKICKQDSKIKLWIVPHKED